MKLAPVWGIDVRGAFNKQLIDTYRQFEPDRALADMLAAYATCCGIFGKPNTSAGFIAGISSHKAIWRLFSEIQEMLPYTDENPATDYGWNIDMVDGTYAPTVTCRCPMDWCWHIIEVLPVLRHIGRHNRAKQLYFNTLQLLAAQADIPTWWNGAYGWASEYFEWQIIREFDEYCEIHGIPEGKEQWDLKKKIDRCAQCYDKGAAKQVEQQIRASARYTAGELYDRVSVTHFPGRLRPLKDWLMMACRFLKRPGCLSDFIYVMDDDQEGLRLDEQVAIIWHDGDFLTNLHTEYMDAEANGLGVMEPVLSHSFLPKHRSFDFEHFNKMREWPSLLDGLIDRHMIMVNNFNNERTNGKNM